MNRWSCAGTAAAGSRPDGSLLFNSGVTIFAPFSISEADVRALAGERSFRRGQQYLDAVSDLVIAADRVAATVHGSDDYAVTLTRGSDGVRASCDCPQGQQGFFCKHCVAVGLTIAQNKPFVPRPRPGNVLQPAGPETTAGVLSWLRTRSQKELVDLIREQLIEDHDWRSRLELRAASAQTDVQAIVSRLEDLLDASGFMPYGYIEEGDSLRYSGRVHEAAAIVDDLVEAGNATGAVAVAQYALDLLATACLDARDPSRAVGDAADELVAAHVKACDAAPPDPAALADFVTSHLLGPSVIPRIDISWYTDLLGAAGLARARERCLDAMKANGAGGREQHALEQVLRAAGDVDALVAVMTANPEALGREHLRAALELEHAGRDADALAVAERGLRQASHPNADLADFVVDSYWAVGRFGDALEVRRNRFEAVRDLAAFQQLRLAALQAGDWPASREWAFGLLRADAQQGCTGVRTATWRAPDPVLIDALIDEGDLDAAWAAAPGLATDAQWLKLADLAAQVRPADALAVYLRQIDPLRSQAGDRAYERMARLLVSARECHRGLGTEQAFDSYLRALRAEQKRKPKLLAVLDRHRL
jgi:hypothetical protein